MKKHQTDIPGMATSNGSAGAWLKLPVEAIQLARNAGCKAFKANGRIDCHALEAWLQTTEQLPEQLVAHLAHRWLTEVYPTLIETGEARKFPE